ncbi:MAG: TIGR03943 family protein [Chloroflexi bacterium]|nr:TIGR03943 family protein [Chloroflexota bacterium]
MTNHNHDHDHAHDERRTMTIQWVKTVILIGLGLYFVYNIISGNLANYINERFAWLSYVAAALFLLLGIYNLIHILTAHGGAHEHDHAHDHYDHEHATLTFPVLAIVAIPLVLGTLIPSRPLGAEAIGGTLSTTAVTGANVATFTVSPEQRNILDWLRTFNSIGDYRELNGQPANVIGFVYSEPAFDPETFMAARFTVSCCVADASAIGLPVRWPGSLDLPQGEWVRVQGTMQVGEFRGDQLPILQATRVEVVDQPAQPYLYP